MRIRTLRNIVGSFFLVSTLFHMFALKWPSISVPESEAEHVAFIFINAWLAERAAMPYRPNFKMALGALTIHQVIVHGSMLVTSTSAQGYMQNIGVFIGLVFVWYATLIESKFTHD